MNGRKIRVVTGILDEEERLILRNSILADSRFEFVEETKDGKELLSAIREKNPEVIILDLLLPYYDGFSILEEIKHFEKSNICPILLSKIKSDAIVKQAFILGAQDFFQKPYDSKVILDKVALCMNTEGEKDAYVSLEEKKVASFLRNMGISANIMGYHYIKTAVIAASLNSEVLLGITKRLYPYVAKTHKTTPNRVERAIRHALESSWKKGGSLVYSKTIGIEQKNKPTNSQFISTLVEYLRLGI